MDCYGSTQRSFFVVQQHKLKLLMNGAEIFAEVIYVSCLCNYILINTDIEIDIYICIYLFVVLIYLRPVVSSMRNEREECFDIFSPTSIKVMTMGVLIPCSVSSS